MKRHLFLLVAITLLSCLWFPPQGLAVVSLPDIGIDYDTMKVNQAAKLTAAGMTNVRNGDAIFLHFSPEKGKIIFKNLRTSEELAYPPVRRKEKDKEGVKPSP